MLMVEITDSEGTVFDVEKHLLTDNPVAPFRTSTGKFRKIREGSSNDADLVERWNESLSKQAPAIQEQVDEAPVKLPEVEKKASFDLEAIAASINDCHVRLVEGGGMFSKGYKYKAFINPANYRDENHIRMALRAHGIV